MNIDLKPLYGDTLLSDVTFIVSNQRFPSHRAILTAAGDYFKNVFLGSFRESMTPDIKIDEVDVPIFEIVLKYIYGYPLPSLKWDQRMSVLILINRFQLINFDYKSNLPKDVDSEDAGEYYSALTLLFPNKIPEYAYKSLASFITAKTNFAELPDEILKEIFKSSSYDALGDIPSDVAGSNLLLARRAVGKFNIIDNLVKMYDRDPKLYLYLRYENIPPIIRQNINPQIILQYGPKSSKDIYIFTKPVIDISFRTKNGVYPTDVTGTIINVTDLSIELSSQKDTIAIIFSEELKNSYKNVSFFLGEIVNIKVYYDKWDRPTANKIMKYYYSI